MALGPMIPTLLIVMGKIMTETELRVEQFPVKIKNKDCSIIKWFPDLRIKTQMVDLEKCDSLRAA